MPPIQLFPDFWLAQLMGWPSILILFAKSSFQFFSQTTRKLACSVKEKKNKPHMDLLGFCSASETWKHRTHLEFLIEIRSRTFPLSLSQRGQRREKMKRGRGVKSKYVAPCLPWLSCTLIDSGLPIPLTCLLCLPSPHTRLSCQSGRKIERQGILRYSPGARLWSFDWLNGFPKLLVLFHQLPLALNNPCQAEMRDRKVGRNWADELRYCGKFQTRVYWSFL